MDIAQVFFYVFASTAIISAAFIAITKNIIYASFSLMATLFSVAAIYVFAGADFIAITQILIYVGGVLILIIFGVMLTNRLAGKALITSSGNYLVASICGIGVLSILLYTIFAINFSAIKWIQQSEAKIEKTTIHTLGYGLMSDYILVFELIALLLLVALIGAVVLAGNKITITKKSEE